MQRFKSVWWLMGTALPLLVAACVVDQPLSSKSNIPDSGKKGTGGSGGKAGSSGTSGSGNTTGMSGSVDNGGSGGAGVSGSGGAAGSDDMDASMDTGPDVVDTGPAAPEASTCAGFALKLDGFSYASINRIVSDDFTLEAWLKTDQVSLTGNNFWDGTGLIYADQTTNTDDFGASMLNGHLTMGVGNPDTTLQGTSTINSGQWVHIATTRQMSTGNIEVIVNGVLETTQAVATQNRSLTAQPFITIGGNTIDGRYLTGTMDEVRIWNVVRTPAEITATMKKVLVGNEAGLVGYWKFDEGTGLSSADRTNGKTGGDAMFSGATFAVSDAPVCP